MALWTDLITPSEATGYVRRALEDLDTNQTTLARWLPNVFVPDISVRFRKGQRGYIAEARFRAFDAEPEFAGGFSGQRVSIELPALGQQRAVSEYDQLRNQNAPDESIRDAIFEELQAVAVAIFNRIERLRGTVISTGRATVNQSNFGFDDNFGRLAAHNATVAALWSTGTNVSRLTDLTGVLQTYSDNNDGELPGAMVMSRRVLRSLSAGTEFSLTLANGTSRPADADSLRTQLDREEVPPFYIYDRSTAGGRVLPNDSIYFLPAPVDPGQNRPTELGATYWGRTLTSLNSDYGIVRGEQPGVVAAATKADRIPHIAGVESDAIALPVLGNADRSFALKVL